MSQEVIGGFKVHPVASLFPMMDDDAYEGLRESIREHGQIFPIIVQEDTLLDGRNRLKACLELKKQPKILEYDGKIVPGEYIFQVNCERRDLTEDQRLDISLAATPLIRAEAKARMQAAGERGKEGGRGNTKTPATVRSQGFSLDIEDSPPPKPKRAPDTRKKMAEKMGVSERKAQQYLNVATSAPELLADVKAGKTKLAAAAKVASARRPKQKAAPSWKTEIEVKKIREYIARSINRCPTEERRRFKTELKGIIDNAATD